MKKQIPFTVKLPLNVYFHVTSSPTPCIKQVELQKGDSLWTVVSEDMDEDSLSLFTEKYLIPWSQEWPKNKVSIPLLHTPSTILLKKGLAEVACGETIFYKTFAALIGKPKAVRHAASLLAHNPFPLILPCHRVIKSDGTVGGYLGGERAKNSILQFEKGVLK